MTPVIPPQQRRALVGDLIASGKLLDALYVHLVKTELVINKQTTLAQLEAAEADFDGYAPIGPVVWGAVMLDGTDNAVVLGQLCQFTMNGLTTPQSIYGYWLQKSGSAPGDLVMAAKLDQSVSLTEIGNGVLIVPKFNYGQ